MRYTCHYSHTLVSVALFIAMAAFSTNVSAGQTTEVQIMVNGSWDFVEDLNPNNDPTALGKSLNRVVLVAPQTNSHGAFIFSGNDATKFKDATGAVIPAYSISKPGIYYLEVNNLRQNYDHSPLPNDLKPQVCSNMQPTWQSITAKKIRDVLYNHPNSTGMSRFAVSLPVPDYYTTYSGQFGLSESKVDINPITAQSSASNYTTWMVLHYWVNNVTNAAPSATLSALVDDGSTFANAAYAFSGSSGAPGISVVMAAVNGMNNEFCDSFSQESFDHSTALWGLVRYAVFPEEDKKGSGVQIPGSYPGCTCPPGKVCLSSGGSADCHACQMSVNGIIENSAP